MTPREPRIFTDLVIPESVRAATKTLVERGKEAMQLEAEGKLRPLYSCPEAYLRSMFGMDAELASLAIQAADLAEFVLPETDGRKVVLSLGTSDDESRSEA